MTVEPKPLPRQARSSPAPAGDDAASVRADHVAVWRLFARNAMTDAENLAKVLDMEGTHATAIVFEKLEELVDSLDRAEAFSRGRNPDG